LLYANGDAQVTAAPPSSWHWKVEFGFDEVNVKLGAGSFDGSGGVAVIVVSGGTVSTVQEYVAAVGSVFPSASVAVTENVWPPSASPT
jgi:hypothetical protein